jgi:hypothetical protein
VKLQLKRGDELLGILCSYGNDFPWIKCNFERAGSFGEVKSLFEEELRLLDADDMEAWEICYEQIYALGLRLVDEEDMKEIGEFLLHIRGDKAWFRF